jgi:hypothetical protein
MHADCCHLLASGSLAVHEKMILVSQFELSNFGYVYISFAFFTRSAARTCVRAKMFLLKAPLHISHHAGSKQLRYNT